MLVQSPENADGEVVPLTLFALNVTVLAVPVKVSGRLKVMDPVVAFIVAVAALSKVQLPGALAVKLPLVSESVPPL